MDTDRLKQLFTALYTDNQGTRDAAALHLYRHLKQEGVHPDDLIVEIRGERHARQDRIIERHQLEATQLRRELAFFKEHADAKLLRKAARTITVENRWESFHHLIGQRLKGYPNGWKGVVRKMVGVTVLRLTLWEQGVVRIPDSAFDLLRTAALPERKRSEPKRRVNGTGKPKRAARHAQD